MSKRPFRFGVVTGQARSAEEWIAKARRAESLGFSSFLVPVFFVLMGMRVQLSAFAQPGVLGLAGLLTLAAVAVRRASVRRLEASEEAPDRRDRPRSGE